MRRRPSGFLGFKARMKDRHLGCCILSAYAVCPRSRSRLIASRRYSASAILISVRVLVEMMLGGSHAAEAMAGREIGGVVEVFRKAIKNRGTPSMEGKVKNK